MCQLEKVLGPLEGWRWAYEEAMPKHIRLKNGAYIWSMFHNSIWLNIKAKMC